jgi:hypothetical protein
MTAADRIRDLSPCGSLGRAWVRLAQGKGLIIPDDAKTSTAAMSAWIDTNRVKKRSKRNRKSSEGWYAPPGVDLSAFGDRGWLL